MDILEYSLCTLTQNEVPFYKQITQHDTLVQVIWWKLIVRYVNSPKWTNLVMNPIERVWDFPKRAVSSIDIHLWVVTKCLLQLSRKEPWFSYKKAVWTVEYKGTIYPLVTRRSVQELKVNRFLFYGDLNGRIAREESVKIWHNTHNNSIFNSCIKNIFMQSICAQNYIIQNFICVC